MLIISRNIITSSLNLFEIKRLTLKLHKGIDYIYTNTLLQDRSVLIKFFASSLLCIYMHVRYSLVIAGQTVQPNWLIFWHPWVT